MNLVISPPSPTTNLMALETASSPTVALPTLTNTLVIASLPPKFFSHPSAPSSLRTHFSSLGNVFAWAPLKGLGRIIVVYRWETDAENAKKKCDGMSLGGHRIRVYRAAPTYVPSSEYDEPRDYHLHPPALDKNFLISPPGSPPIGWEPVVEDPPNSAPLADDLIAALTKLKYEQDREEDHNDGVLISVTEDHGIGVRVEDWSEKQDHSDPGSTKKDRIVPIPASMPPLPASFPLAPLSAPTARIPTARPPLSYGR